MRQLLLVTSFLSVPALALAQEAPPSEPINWIAHASTLINMVLIPIVYQLLKNNIWPNVPSWVKAILAAVSGSGFMMLGQFLLQRFGLDVDFSSLIELFTVGLGAGAASAVAFSMGKTQERTT